jgi:hypothetical protein
MSLLSFYLDLFQALDDIGAPYMIVGAFGASAFGLGRSTLDVDIVVALREEQCDALAARFPPPRYYADPEQMLEGIALGMMFNLIDSERGAKADLTPLSMDPGAQHAFARRIRRSFRDEQGVVFEAWCARVDDIILGKLAAWQEGRSAKHLNDIATLVRFDVAGLNARYPIDRDYVAQGAAEIGPEALRAWREIVARSG